MAVTPVHDDFTLEGLIARLRTHTAPPESPALSASVAVVLRAPSPDREAEVLFIERAVREGDPWSGHMAFPGGRRDAHETPFETALRETREELSLDLAADAHYLTRLDDVPVLIRSHQVDMRVAPFVFALHRDAPLTPNREVADTLWHPLGALARGEHRGTFPFTWQGTEHALPCHRVGERVVWGLTYLMLEGLFEALGLQRVKSTVRAE